MNVYKDKGGLTEGGVDVVDGGHDVDAPDLGESAEHGLSLL